MDLHTSRTLGIDTDVFEKAIDTLTIEFGCEYCQHAFHMGDADFNKLSTDELLKDMRKEGAQTRSGSLLWSPGGFQSHPRVAGRQRLPAPHH